jgi:ABC-2 type transport system ATP-binding protein
MIRCEQLTKRFGDFTAVDALSLEVAPGELFGFLGPNGAGKTTTIRMLTGLLIPSAGEASIGPYNILTQSLDAKRITGYVPDSAYLYEKLTGYEMLILVADLWGVDHTRREAKITDLLRLFELSDKRDELIQGYSRGMKQKLSLAAALLHEPRVLFLDEPTVGLDPKAARVLKEVLRELAGRGTTVFVSTHILEIAERLCARVGIVNHGKLIAEGTIEELRAGGDSSLEDIFLRLTGDAEYGEIIRLLD